MYLIIVVIVKKNIRVLSLTYFRYRNHSSILVNTGNTFHSSCCTVDYLNSFHYSSAYSLYQKYQLCRLQRYKISDITNKHIINYKIYAIDFTDNWSWPFYDKVIIQQTIWVIQHFRNIYVVPKSIIYEMSELFLLLFLDQIMQYTYILVDAFAHRFI